MERWCRGDGVLLRHVHGGFVRYAIPTTVVEDSQQRVALYLAEGTPLRWTTRLASIKEPVAAPEERRWQWTNVLMISESDAAHSVWVMWHASTDAFLGWYVNLQRPLVRTSLGFDTWDQSLDIVVEDQLRWRWKDEDDFAEVQRLGILDAGEALQVRAEGKAVIVRIDAREPPFSGDWPSWTPDPTWPVPAIPRNWADVPPAPPA